MRSPRAVRRWSRPSGTRRTPRCSTWSPICASPRPRDAAKEAVPDVGEEHERVRELRDRACASINALSGPGGARSRRCAGPARDGGSARMVDERAEEVASLLERARRTLGHLLDRAEAELTHTRARVVALSPAATLQRGYAVLQRDGRPRGPRARRRPAGGRRAAGAGGGGRVRRHCRPARIGWPHDLGHGDGCGREGGYGRRAGAVRAGLRAGPGRTGRGRPASGGGRHDAGGVAGAVGARRGAGEGLPASGWRGRGRGWTRCWRPRRSRRRKGNQRKRLWSPPSPAQRTRKTPRTRAEQSQNAPTGARKRHMTPRPWR